jgi:Protein of unknown function (DUF3500)
VTDQVTDWKTYGLRDLPGMSARSLVVDSPPPIQVIVDERLACLAEPLRGVTTDGTVRPGLYRLDQKAGSTAAISETALGFLDALTREQRTRATFPMDSDDWRRWINVHMNYFRHGVMLEDLPQPTRELALAVVATTLSAHGMTLARNILRVNELVAEVSGRPDEFGEWPYFMSIFGSPGAGQPWGWQLDGHHLNVNCVVFDDQIVMTPTFMGSEPCRFVDGPLAGVSMFSDEERGGIDLIRSLDTAQQSRAIRYPSIMPGDVPPELENLFDGRIEAGACHDNRVLPYQGVPAVDLSDAQRRLLVSLLDTYVGRMADDHATVRMAEVTDHLDETWFSWYGGTGDASPFYYRVHSPVVLIEFDHQKPANLRHLYPDAPYRDHIHAVMRTPNGNDYGKDLLRQHYAQHPH